MDITRYLLVIILGGKYETSKSLCLISKKLAQELVALGKDKELDEQQRMFAYMPYMHSESLIIHDEAVRLFSDLGNQQTLEFEISHRDIIVEFSRFPKRNKALGRISTKEEIAYIAGRDGYHF